MLSILNFIYKIGNELLELKQLKATYKIKDYLQELYNPLNDLQAKFIINKFGLENYTRELLDSEEEEFWETLSDYISNLNC